MWNNSLSCWGLNCTICTRTYDRIWQFEFIPCILVVSSILCQYAQFSTVQWLSSVRIFVMPWIAALWASLSITNSWSSPKLMSIESVMPSSHLILCRPLLLLPPIPSSTSQLFTWGGQSTGVSALASVLPKNTQDCVDPIQRKKSTIYTASYLEDLDCFYLKEHGRKKTGYLFLHATEAERKKTKGCITQLHNNECGFITQPAIFNIKSNSANAWFPNIKSVLVHSNSA